MATQNLGRVAVVHQGAYAPGTTYQRNDEVAWNGSSYRSRIDSNTALPSNAAAWVLVSSRGEEGPASTVPGPPGEVQGDGTGISNAPAFRDRLNAARRDGSRVPELVPLALDSYNSFPGAARMSNGRIIVAWRRGTNHNDGGTIRTIYSDDNGVTWSSPTTVYQAAGADARDCGVSVIQDAGVEKVALIFSVENPNGSGSYRNYLYKSDDGATWGAGVELVDSVGKFATTEVLDLGAGKWIYAAYGATSPNRPYVYRTADYGATWAVATMGDNQNEVGFQVVGGDVFALIRRQNNTGFNVEKSSDNGATWVPQAASFGAVSISHGSRPNIVWDGAAYYCFYRSPHGLGMGGIAVMVSDDMLTWRPFCKLPTSVSQTFVYGAWVVIDGAPCAAISGEMGASAGLKWTTLAKMRQLSDTMEGGSPEAPDVPYLNPAATRHFIEDWVAEDTGDTTTGTLGRWKWNHGGHGSVAYGQATLRPFGGVLTLTTGTSTGQDHWIAGPAQSATNIDRASAVTFCLAPANWDDICLRVGWYGGNVPSDGGTIFRMVEIDRAVSGNWRYRSNVSTGGAGAVDQILAPAVLANGRPLSITICGVTYNDRKLGGSTDHARIVINQVNGSAIAQAVCDVEVFDPGVINGRRLFVELIARAAGGKSVRIDQVEIDLGNIYSMANGVPL